MPSSVKKTKVTANIGKNRLLFTFSGWITKKDLDSLYTDVRFCVADLKPGFDVITDLSECTFGSLNCITTFRKIMNFLMENRAGKVIRVTRSNSLIHKQIINLAAKYQGYKPVYVATLEEAERFLEESDRKSDLSFRLHQTPVHFSVNGEKGTGYVREISTDRCTIDFFASSLKVDDEILLQLEFLQHDGSPQNFEITSKVAGIEQDYIAAEFVGLDEERKQLLRKCLVHEAQKEVQTR